MRSVPILVCESQSTSQRRETAGQKPKSKCGETEYLCPLTCIKQNDAKSRRTPTVSYHLHDKGSNGRTIKWIFEMGGEGINCKLPVCIMNLFS